MLGFFIGYFSIDLNLTICFHINSTNIQFGIYLYKNYIRNMYNNFVYYSPKKPQENPAESDEKDTRGLK